MEIETVSDLFYARTRKRYLYNITAIANIPSIIQHGIVSHDSAQRFQHNSIAMTDVQERRSLIKVPNGLRLHQYANLYFTYHNPMMYKRKELSEALCVLAVSAAVLNIDECVVSDMNAAASLVRFYSAAEGIGVLDFDMVFAEYWVHPGDIIKTHNHKAIKCAEILVPFAIPFSYIDGAYVVSQKSKEALESTGFNKRIVVRPSVFFQ